MIELVNILKQKAYIPMTFKPFFMSLALVMMLAACGSVPEGEAKYPTRDRTQTGGDVYAKRETVWGEGGISILGGKDKKSSDVITVNAYLWRAALDTVNFMPLTTVDPFGGVILTDWYSNEKTPTERYKLNIFVLGNQLRSDGIKVTMFKQRKGKGDWTNVEADEAANRAIEDAILTRARQLRVADIQAEE